MPFTYDTKPEGQYTFDEVMVDDLVVLCDDPFYSEIEGSISSTSNDTRV